MARTTANTPVPHLGQDGAGNVTEHAARSTCAINALQELVCSLMGGPGFYAGNLAQREQNAPGYDVVGSDFGQEVIAYEGDRVRLFGPQAPVRITSVLAALEGGTIEREGGGVLTLERIHGGPGRVEDRAALLRLEDFTRSGNLIEDNYSLFVVNERRELSAPLISTEALFVGGRRVTAGGAAQTDFSDDEFSIYDAADPTKIAAFDASGITAATTRVYALPDASGTLALLSDLPTEFEDATFELYDDGDSTRRARFECENITPGNTRVLYVPDDDGTIALVSQIVTDHDQLGGLTGADDHTQYLLLAGRGGQLITDSIEMTGDLVVGTTIDAQTFRSVLGVAGAGTAPVAVSLRQSNPGDNGVAGDGHTIEAQLENDASTTLVGGFLRFSWEDPSAGAEFCNLHVSVRRNGGTFNALAITPADGKWALLDSTWNPAAEAEETLWVFRGGEWICVPPGAEGDVLQILAGVVAWAPPP